ncbi:MAG: adenylate/guanylate cyclase domain-containing protein, partial [Acidimicrobiia bacterium]
QREMAATTWAPGPGVRVRIGLHSGSPAVTDTGYVGLPVHVMARVGSAGHGGQVLITRATREEIGDAPAGVGFSSLGEFRLQGLPQPEELFQVAAPGLETDFPAPRVADKV